MLSHSKSEAVEPAHQLVTPELEFVIAHVACTRICIECSRSGLKRAIKVPAPHSDNVLLNIFIYTYLCVSMAYVKNKFYADVF